MNNNKILNKITRIVATAALGVTASVSADILVMGGNPAGSLFYSQAQALAATISKHTGHRVDVLPQPGTVFFPMFMTGEADIGIASPVEALLAYNAEPPFEGANGGEGYGMRTLMLGSPIRLSLVTREDSGIETLSDLEGKRVVADYGAFAGATKTSLAALANAGLTADDVRVVRVSSYPEGVRAVMEGRADAAVGSIGSGVLQELDASAGARILPIDPSPEAMARTQEVGPAFVSLMVEAGPVGVDQDTTTLSYSITLYSRPDMSDDHVRSVIDSLWNNYGELDDIHRSLVTWTPDRFVGLDAVIPYHSAAVDYYREQGVWTDAMEKRQQQLLAN